MAKKKAEAANIELQLDTKYLFTNKNNEFIASIQSFDPLRVTQHSVKNGCQSEAELSIDSLDEYAITAMSKDEVFAILSNAGNY